MFSGGGLTCLKGWQGTVVLRPLIPNPKVVVTEALKGRGIETHILAAIRRNGELPPTHQFIQVCGDFEASVVCFGPPRL